MPAKTTIGRFGRAHGVCGWLRVNSFTEPATNIFDYAPWQIQRQGQWSPIQIEAKKILGNGIIVKLAGCDDCDQAKLFTNINIAVDFNTLPTLASDEYYWQQLIGLRVETQQGVLLGTVDHLMATGANDVLVIKNDRERLLPYSPNTIVSVDLDNQLIIVDWDPSF